MRTRSEQVWAFMAMLQKDDCEHRHFFRDGGPTGTCRVCEYVGPIFIMQCIDCEFTLCLWCSQDWYKNGGYDAFDSRMEAELEVWRRRRAAVDEGGSDERSPVVEELVDNEGEKPAVVDDDWGSDEEFNYNIEDPRPEDMLQPSSLSPLETLFCSENVFQSSIADLKAAGHKRAATEDVGSDTLLPPDTKKLRL